MLQQLHQRGATAADRNGLAASAAGGTITTAGAFAAGARPAGRVVALVIIIVVFIFVVIVIRSLVAGYRTFRHFGRNVFLPALLIWKRMLSWSPLSA